MILRRKLQISTNISGKKRRVVTFLNGHLKRHWLIGLMITRISVWNSFVML